MSLVVLGVSYQLTPLVVREKLMFQPDHMQQTLKGLINEPYVDEAVVLSTCNRTEIYTSASKVEPLKQYFARKARVQDSELDSYVYTYYNDAAVQHAMRVASGLDSMIMGEAQILGQMKKAYALACEVGTVGVQLRHLFPATFAASKRIRQETAIGHNPVSMAYVIVQLAKEVFLDLPKTRVLLIGAGETIELVHTYLHAQQVQQLIIANRTLQRAQRLATSSQATPIRLADIPYYLSDVDIVIAATSSQLPILGKGMLESVLKHRSARPLFMVDLAVPRNIEPEASELLGVHLYNIDHLQSIVATNLRNRTLAAEQAEAMVDIQTAHYLRRLRVLKAGDLIRRFRTRMEKLRDEELARALLQLQRVESSEKIMASLARNLTNKMLHRPTVVLRQAACEARLDLLLSVKDLFDL